MVLLEAGPVQEFAPDQYAVVTGLGDQSSPSVSTPRASETPAPLLGEVTDSSYEEARGCADVLVGCLGVWW